jgi:hypothetical protein
MLQIAPENLEARAKYYNGGNQDVAWSPGNVGNGSMRLGSLWEESCKSFRSGMAMEGVGIPKKSGDRFIG